MKDPGGVFVNGLWVPYEIGPVKHDVLGDPYVEIKVETPRRLVELGAEAEYSRRVAFRMEPVVVGVTD